MPLIPRSLRTGIVPRSAALDRPEQGPIELAIKTEARAATLLADQGPSGGKMPGPFVVATVAVQTTLMQWCRARCFYARED